MLCHQLFFALLPKINFQSHCRPAGRNFRPWSFQSRSLSIPHSQQVPQKLQVQISMVQCRSQATYQEKISTKRYTWDACTYTVIHNVPVAQKGGWSCRQSCFCVHQTLLPAVMRWNHQTNEQCVHYFLLFHFPRHLSWTSTELCFLPREQC